MPHWYCKTCKDRKEPHQVTFQENCEDCGTEVEWIETEKDEITPWILVGAQLPKIDSDEFYGNHFSVPVVVCNAITGRTQDQFVRWCYAYDGWVEANFNEGDNPADYEMNHVTHWMHLPDPPATDL